MEHACGRDLPSLQPPFVTFATHAPHFLTRLFGFSPQPLDLFTFYDYGVVSNVNLLPGERDDRDLSSVGIGARFRYKDVLRCSLAYGHQLTPAEPGEDADSRVDVSLLLSF